jgi:photosystem II stability/assembly factor-like uncharacterized protein
MISNALLRGLTLTSCFVLSACGMMMMPKPTECTIDGVKVAPKGTNPDPEFGLCQFCDLALNPNGWTNASLGTSCATAQICISGGRCARTFRKLTGTGTGTWQDVTGSSADEVWVVGAAQTALRSTDRGATWTPSTLPGIESRYGVYSPSAGRAFIVGGAGSVLETQNGGMTWTELPPPTRRVLKAIWGSSANEMIAVGTTEYIGKSTNGGMSWSTRRLVGNDAGIGNTLNSVWGDASAIYTVGEGGAIFRSTDRGNTWQRAASVPVLEYLAVYGTGGQVFVTGGGGTFLRSNGDNMWTRLNFPSNADLSDVWGVGTEIFVSTQRGQVFRSTNSGDSWAELSTAGTQILYGLWGSSVDDLYAVGASGVVLHQP